MSFSPPDFLIKRRGTHLQPTLFSHDAFRRTAESNATPDSLQAPNNNRRASSVLSSRIESPLQQTRSKSVISNDRSASLVPVAKSESKNSHATASRNSFRGSRLRSIAQLSVATSRVRSSSSGSKAPSATTTALSQRSHPSIFNSMMFSENAHMAAVSQRQAARTAAHSSDVNLLDMASGDVDAEDKYIPLPSSIQWTCSRAVPAPSYTKMEVDEQDDDDATYDDPDDDEFNLKEEENDPEEGPEPGHYGRKKKRQKMVPIAEGLSTANAVLCTGSRRACIVSPSTMHRGSSTHCEVLNIQIDEVSGNVTLAHEAAVGLLVPQEEESQDDVEYLVTDDGEQQQHSEESIQSPNLNTLAKAHQTAQVSCRVAEIFDAAPDEQQEATTAASPTATVATSLVTTSNCQESSTASVIRSASGMLWLATTLNSCTEQQHRDYAQYEQWQRRNQPQVGASRRQSKTSSPDDPIPPPLDTDAAPRVVMQAIVNRTMVPQTEGIHSGVSSVTFSSDIEASNVVPVLSHRSLLPGFEGCAMCGGGAAETVYCTGGFAKEVSEREVWQRNSKGHRRSRIQVDERLHFSHDVYKVILKGPVATPQDKHDGIDDSIDDTLVTFYPNEREAPYHVNHVMGGINKVVPEGSSAPPGLAYHSAVLFESSKILCFGGFIFGEPTQQYQDTGVVKRRPSKVSHMDQSSPASDPDEASNMDPSRRNTKEDTHSLTDTYDGVLCRIHPVKDNTKSDNTLRTTSAMDDTLPFESRPVPRGEHFPLCCGNGLYEFNTRSKQWTHHVTVGEVPSARAHHSASIYGPWMLVVGGKSIKRTASASVSGIDVRTTTPANKPSLLHDGSVDHSNHDDGASLVWEPCNDVFMLHCQLKMWVKVESSPYHPMPSVFGHFTVVTPRDVVVLSEHGVAKAPAASFLKYANTKRRIVQQQLRKSGERPLLLRTEGEICTNVARLFYEDQLPPQLQDLRRQELFRQRELAVVTEGEDSKLRNIKLNPNMVHLAVRRLTDKTPSEQREKSREKRLQQIVNANNKRKPKRVNDEQFARRHHQLPLELKHILREEQQNALEKKLSRNSPTVVESGRVLGARLMRNQRGEAEKERLLRKLMDASEVGRQEAAVKERKVAKETQRRERLEEAQAHGLPPPEDDSADDDDLPVLERLTQRDGKSLEKKQGLYAKYVVDARADDQWKPTPYAHSKKKK